MTDVIRLRGGGLTMDVLPLGAIIRDLRFEDAARSLVLGFPDAATYRANPSYIGAVVGRFANRITGGRLPLDGRVFPLDRNEGPNTLHGGTEGFHRRLWEIVEQGSDAVTLALTSPHGDQGFPGTLYVTCRYRLTSPGTVIMDLDAVSDAPTVVSLAQHVYWNLDGAPTIDGHHLEVRADRALATDAASLPTVIEPARRLGALAGTALDRNFCLATVPRAAPEPAAVLEAGGVRLEVATTEPGLQVYTGDKLDVPPFGHRGGLCLEAQAWPDAPNRPDFPSARLDPGEVYRQRTVWQLSRTLPPAAAKPDDRSASS
jgi:aldose 1-epimerase